jgi:hypothetical protein
VTKEYLVKIPVTFVKSRGQFGEMENESRPTRSYQKNQHILESSTEERDLCVVISDNLKSVANCRAAYVKTNRVLGMIRRTGTYKSAQILLPLYKTLVRILVELLHSVVVSSLQQRQDND